MYELQGLVFQLLSITEISEYLNKLQILLHLEEQLIPILRFNQQKSDNSKAELSSLHKIT